jgi:hypothetical protein
MHLWVADAPASEADYDFVANARSEVESLLRAARLAGW